jgi:hypothetical protein
MGPDDVLGSREVLGLAAIDGALLRHAHYGPEEFKMRDAVLTGRNALPEDDLPDVTRSRSAAARRVQAHRVRARLGFRCLTVRVGDREVRHLISRGYLSLENREVKASVAIALEAWIYDNLP